MVEMYPEMRLDVKTLAIHHPIFFNQTAKNDDLFPTFTRVVTVTDQPVTSCFLVMLTPL